MVGSHYQKDYESRSVTIVKGHQGLDYCEFCFFAMSHYEALVNFKG